MKTNRRSILSLALFPVLAGLATLVSGCDGSAQGEGYLDVRNSEFFTSQIGRGEHRVSISVEKCRDRGSNADDIVSGMSRRTDETQEQFDRRREDLREFHDREHVRWASHCTRASEIGITFSGRALSVFTMAFDVRCRNLAGTRVLCVGGDGDLNPRFGPVRYVSITDGSRLLGLQIWQMEPSRAAYDPLIALHGPAAGPVLMATFGEMAPSQP